MQRLDPPELAPPVKGVYTQISIVPTGRLAFVSGQVAIDEKGELVGPGDYGAQATQCFRNIKAAIAAVGATPAQVAKMTLNIVNHRDELVDVIFAAGRTVFGDDWPICASIFLGVQALGSSDWLVEIDVVVVLPEG